MTRSWVSSKDALVSDLSIRVPKIAVPVQSLAFPLLGATAPYFYRPIILRALKSNIIVVLTYGHKK